MYMFGLANTEECHCVDCCINEINFPKATIFLCKYVSLDFGLLSCVNMMQTTKEQLNLVLFTVNTKSGGTKRKKITFKYRSTGLSSQLDFSPSDFPRSFLTGLAVTSWHILIF